MNKRKVTAQVRRDFDIEDAAVAYWDSLGFGAQERYYGHALNDIRCGNYWETMNGLDGQVGYRGKGCVLAQAVDAAFEDSPEEVAKRKAKVAAEREAWESTIFECRGCRKQVERRAAYVYRETAVCFECAA